jgi:hypothetical protein
MHEPWEESWQRPASGVRSGPSPRERWTALVILAAASAGFLVTVVWPVVAALR